MAARLQIADGCNDGLIRRRATIGGAAVVQADERRIGARETGNRPTEWGGLLLGIVDGRTNETIAGAQIRTEPTDHERRRLGMRQSLPELIERDSPVRATATRVGVLRNGFSTADTAGDWFGCVDEFTGARNENDTLDRSLERIDGAMHLEGKLW